MWIKSFCIPDSRPVLFFFPWPGVLARAVGPWSCLFVERSPSARESAHPSRLSSTTRKGEQGPRQSARSPNTARSRQSAHLFLPQFGPNERAYRDDVEREVATPFFLFFYGFCVNACGEAPVGDTIEQYKCCRVFAFIRIFFCIVFVAVYD